MNPIEEISKEQKRLCQVSVAHVYNSDYLGGGNWEDQVQGQPGQIVGENLISKITKAKWTRGMAQAVRVPGL
jgi:hypothetical protein